MIGELLAVFAIALMLIRISMFDKVSVYLLAVELLSGILMFVAMVFLVLPPNTVVTSNILVSSGANTVYTITGNQVVAYGPSLSGWEPSLIYMAVMAWEIFVVVWVITDVMPIFFRKGGLPGTPKMPR